MRWYRQAQLQGLLPFDDGVEYVEKPAEHESYDYVRDYIPVGSMEGEFEEGFYHVTTNLPAVLQWGALKSRSQLGQVPGLGGGPRNVAPDKVSVTHSLQKAFEIRDGLLFAAEVAHGQVRPSDIMRTLLEAGISGDLEDYLGATWGSDRPSDIGPVGEVLEQYAPTAMRDDEQEGLEEELDARITTPKQAYEFMVALEDAVTAAMADYDDFRPSRVGFTVPFETFSRIDPSRIGIVQMRIRKGAPYEHVPEEMELRFDPDDVAISQVVT